MKYSRLALALLTLTACPVYAQNQQFRACRTLEMARNFVGADEALVDGLVSEKDKTPIKAIVTEPRPARTTELSSVPAPARTSKAGTMGEAPRAAAHERLTKQAGLRQAK